MEKKQHIIVLGNEKGGTGKSTTAMHIITILLKAGYAVGSIDVDARQGTLSRYVANREAYKEKHAPHLPMPHHKAIFRSTQTNMNDATAEDQAQFDAVLIEMADCQYIVVDTPGNDTPLARYAHSFADTLITPMNDSFIDLDVLTRIDPETMAIKSPSIYAEWVWEQKKQRALRDRGSIDWIVLRNRLATMHSKNKEKMDLVLEALGKRMAFRQVKGFSERVIFKELFPQGLTLIDMTDADQPVTLSHIAAREELRTLMEAMNLPECVE